MALETSEAEMLAKALAGIEAQYPTQIDPRVLAWLNLAGVAGMIYGTRIFAYRMRKENEREERRQAPPPPPQADMAATLIQQPNGGNIAPFPDIFTTSNN